jgi:hypothetical protein
VNADEIAVWNRAASQSGRPSPREGEPPFLDESEIILRLHDQDESGRLFSMRSW